jgi:2-polyprenyl-3-methyl-5-hydroxy-6-metoxy-1,4-benzoquinol methylase
VSYLSARLFAWLHGADFYEDLHRAAVEQLPLGHGKSWLDVGCGPGLVPRLAAARGYEAVGIDVDHHMIRVARRLAAREASPATFHTENVLQPGAALRQADVVSAASLLAVVKDKSTALHQLIRCVRPGGKLLIVEPTAQLTVQAADELTRDGALGHRSSGLRMWAHARAGKTVDPHAFGALPYETERIDLLRGLVAAWVVHVPGLSTAT